MWVILAFISATLLGFYDVAKKRALADNAVLPVLLLNTLFSSIIFSPIIITSACGADWFNGSIFEVTQGSMHDHAMVFTKAVMVLASWIFGYIGIKHLPITIVGPINTTRPVMVLVGAMLLFGERLNAWQWAGVLLAIFSIFLLSRSGRKEGINFTHNRWILCIAAAAIIGAGCGLYDRHIMHSLSPMFVQGWYTLYQLVLMGITIAILWFPKRNEEGKKFHWSWAIPLISVFLSCADIAYLYALSDNEAMISVVSMIRRASVIVSFSCGAVLFREKNLRAKALDLLLILVGMILLCIGSR